VQLDLSYIDYYIRAISALTRDELGGSAENMSVASASSLARKRTRDIVSVPDSDAEARPIRGRKVFRSRIIGFDSEASDGGSIVLSDSPEGVSAKVRWKRRSKLLE